ncbi:MAG: HAMP domain-containing histidine kinase [Hydrococcus sp. Prado102]|jgi:signal transduction histidine kinase|nr:HAMP domain-containing histidine kinase [Hydrococcus sp. Prado102]
MSVTDLKSSPNQSKNQSSRRKRGFLWEARTRILAWYSVLMTGFVGLSIPIFSELVFHQVDTRVREDLVEELEAFKQFVAEESSNADQMTQEKLQEIFQEFLYRQIPEDDTFLITFINGQFYRSSPRGRPEQLQEESQLMKRWAKLTQNEQGERETSDPNLGNIVYLASPIIIDGKVQGNFVIAHTTAGEIQEAQQVIWTVTQVLLVVLILALILAWVVSGKILEPLRSLTTTARLISESNLDRRIPVQSSGEMGELAKTFNTMLDRLQTSFSAQKTFINDAGHELRTPIAIVQGHLELMGDDPQEQQETIELVMDELDRMNRMVDDLMLLAKSERSDFLQLETVDIESLTQGLHTKATALGNRNWKIDAIAEGFLVCDRQRLTQAVMNLTENALQYTTETDTIAIGSSRDCPPGSAKGDRNCLRLWVRDTGEGIAQGDREKIFERFARAKNSRRRSEGSGLGLSIVRAIAETHGGRVELISQLGVGSTFTLVLPLLALKKL